MECEGSAWCLCYEDYWTDGVVMECTGVPPAQRGDFFRASAIYVDGVKLGTEDETETQVSGGHRHYNSPEHILAFTTVSNTGKYS